MRKKKYNPNKQRQKAQNASRIDENAVAILPFHGSEMIKAPNQKLTLTGEIESIYGLMQGEIRRQGKRVSEIKSLIDAGVKTEFRITTEDHTGKYFVIFINNIRMGMDEESYMLNDKKELRLFSTLDAAYKAVKKAGGMRATIV